jgi:hypothetical protein
MSEPDDMDRLLSRALSTPVPELPAGFDRRLMRQVRPRRLGAQGRVALALYGLPAIAISVWTMRVEAIEWTLVAAAVVVPVALVAMVLRQYGLRPARG